MSPNIVLRAVCIFKNSGTSCLDVSLWGVADGEAAANDGALASFVQLVNTDGASYDGSTDSSEYENPFDSSDGEYDEAPWP